MTARRYSFALRYPRSFLGLLLAAFLLVALPLIGALLSSAWHMERLTEQSRSAVAGALAVARSGGALVGRATSLERLALQAAALPDARLRDDFARAHEGFGRLVAETSQLKVGSERLSVLERVAEREAALHAYVSSPTRGKLELREVRALAALLVEDAYRFQSVSYAAVDRELGRLGANADELHGRLMAMVLVAIALALAAALVLTRLVARPIAELDSAIRRLGSADFSRPVRVHGPADLRSLGERLDWLRHRLTELEAQKNRFLRHLSHDLKTPLAALREGTELLNDQVAGPLAPPQRQVVSILRDNSVKLQHLIEDLLDYQRALHAASSLKIDALALDELLRQCLRSHQIAAHAKRQRLKLDAASIQVRADAARLRSIVDNLLGNAVKFTPEGGEIRVVARQQGGAATIEFLDSGPGVPPEERDAIFDAFFRGRAAAYGRAEGTGLGLAIAREFAEAHGGRVEAVAGGRGGHFRVTLPLQPGAPLREAA